MASIYGVHLWVCMIDPHIANIVLLKAFHLLAPSKVTNQEGAIVESILPQVKIISKLTIEKI